MVFSSIKNRLGFSLIEIAIALTVAGLLMAGVIDANRVKAVSDPINITKSNFEDIEVSMQKFLALNGRLPCPSRPELSINDRGAGIEVCDIDSFNLFSRSRDKDKDDVVDVGWFPVAGFTYCDDFKDASNGSGYCYVVNNGRDAENDSSRADDIIIQGGIPYKTLGLLSEVGDDGWSVPLRYVVSKKLIDIDTYDRELGAIYVVNSKNVDEIVDNVIDDVVDYMTVTLDNNADDINFNKLYPAAYGSAEFVLLLSGRNRAGDYIYSGSDKLVCSARKKYDCSEGETDFNSEERKNFGLDFENCNQNEFFMSDDKFALMGEGNIQFYLDDIVHDKFSLTSYSDSVWKFSGDIVKPMFSTSVRNDKGTSRVGIGTDTPSASLEVIGNLKADNVKTKKICNTGGECMYLSALLDNAKCSGKSGGLLMSVDSSGNFDCMNAAFINGPVGACAAGANMFGFHPATGAILCR